MPSRLSPTLACTREKLDRWLALYPEHSPSLFDVQAIAQIDPHQFPEQFLRNMVFADRVRGPGERAHVVALVRQLDSTPIVDWIGRCLTSDCEATYSRATWEEIYRALPPDPALRLLRSYFENKSYSLRPAFECGG
jgi:hypothetical protein